MNSQGESAAQEIRGMLLPVGPRLLVLPNAVVAEMLSYQPLASAPGMPDWWLGRLAWRGRHVPVVDFPQALRLPTAPSSGKRRRIVILNSLNASPTLPYMGLYTLGTARLTRLSAANLVSDGEPVTSTLIRASLIVNGLPAWIPDLDQLHQLLVAAAQD